MIRRRGRWLSFLVLAVASGAAAYGCGTGGDDGTDNDPKPLDESGSPDGTITLPDGNVITPDGSTLPDGAPKPDAQSEAGPDAQADTGVDAGIDAGEDSGVVNPPDGPLHAGYVDYEVNHILTVGQSNSIATDSQPQWALPAGQTLITTQPYTNLMFNVGVMTSYPCTGTGCPNGTYVAPTSFVPLIENDRFFNGGAANNVQTISSPMANLISYIALNSYEFGARAGYPTKHDVLVSNHGRSGLTYWCLRKGGCNYNNPGGNLNAFTEGMMQVTAAKDIATNVYAKSHVVRGVTVIHGESDSYGYADNNNNHPEYPLVGTDGTANKIQEYDDAMIEWQADYEAGIKAITGQVQPVPLFIAGVSGYTRSSAAAQSRGMLPNFQLRAHTRAPGKVVLVAPGYIFDYAYQNPATMQPQCRHYSIAGQKHLGEYFAKAYAQVIFKGQPWEPLRPLQITRVANVVTVKYLVPKPPIVIDTTRVAAPTHTVGKYGFDFFDGATPINITNVAVVADDTVEITLASTPVNANKRLSYANEQPFPGCLGTGVNVGGGARGNLRDSDDQVSLNGFELFNWGVTFDMTVP